jgi:hypothetical protein
MEEFLDNLLFSATLPLVAFPDPGAPPLSDFRIVHNGARRRLAERYGFEEYRVLAEHEQARCFARQLHQSLIDGIGLWIVMCRYFRKSSN